MRIIAVFFTVSLTFLTSLILNVASSEYNLLSFIGFMIIFLVFAINVVKFIAWGWLNKRYDLSKTYPLTALFFPLIFIYAVVIEDTILTVQKVLGLTIILVGLYVMEITKKEV